MKLKKVVSLCLVAVLLLSTMVSLATQGSVSKVLDYMNISIRVNGEEITPKNALGATVEPFAMEGTTYVPLRAVGEALGYDVSWDQATKTVSVNEQNTQATTAVFAETTSGGVMGYNENGINKFWGIPYAQAERFMPPTAYPAWEGYRVCWTIGESAPQNDAVSPFDFMPNSMQIVESEENLFKLQIQSPDLNPTTLKPVVVWFHGGGYTTGASMEFDMYDGSNLAEYGDVVFVGVNHRLNVLGFLDLSAYGEKYKYSGNVGILDLEFSLQWIQDNIKSFGGDPNNVTIVGQSGGGSKVTTLMGMPSATGLFHKAAALSGGSAQITRTTETARAESAKLLEQLGISASKVDTLADLPYEELYAAANAAGVTYGPVVDGDLIPTGNFAASSNIPFLAGNVLGEFSTNIGGMATHNQTSEAAFLANALNLTEEEVLAQLTARYGDSAQAILTAFRTAYPGHKDAGALYLNNRYGKGMSAIPLVTAMDSYGGTCYNYVQAYVYPMFGGIVPIHTASCIPFWFHNMEYIPAWIAGDEVAAHQVSNQMAGALVAFARTGNPSQDGLKWEPWTASNHATMVFDTETSMRYGHDKELFDLISAAS